MYFDSEALWEQGEPTPSMYDKVLDFLRTNSEHFFVAADVGEHALGDASAEDSEGLTGEKWQLQMAMTVAADARVETILEQLVREGLVEKREIPMQAIAQQLDKEMPQLREELPPEVAAVPYESDFGGMTATYYRIARDDL